MPTANRAPDVAIVGGGLAGAAAACRLAAAGRRVLVLERERGPHHKVCGEFVSHEAAADLARLGIHLAALGAEPVEAVRLVAGATIATAALPFRAFGLSRRRLDDALLTHAAALGAEVRRGAAARGIEAGPEIRLADGTRLRAACVFLATGKHDLRGWARPAPTDRDALVGLKMHLRLAPAAAALARHVELYFFAGGYAGLQRVESGDANLCLLLRPALLKRLGCWDRVLAHLATASPVLDSRLRGALCRWDRPLAVSRLPYGHVHESGPATGVWRLGDQAAVTPSFTGDGMAIALHSARRAAELFLAGRTDAAYHDELRADVHGQVAVSTALSRALGLDLLRGPLFAALRLWPGLVRAGARLTRLPHAA